MNKPEKKKIIKKMFTIGIDGYGLKKGPKEIIKGVKTFYKKYKNIKIIIIGEKKDYYDFQNKIKDVSYVEGKNNIGHEDTPLSFRHKLDSSLVKSISLLKHNKIDALISCNNSGMYIAVASLLLKKVDSSIKPSFGTFIPKYENDKMLFVLDCGASLVAYPKRYLFLSRIAKIYINSITKNNNPKIGLLNIGKSKNKGSKNVISAFNLLSNEKGINFIGNVEPHDVFFTECEILLTDGWTGNILLKSLEGTYKLFSRLLKNIVGQNKLKVLAFLLIKKDIREMKKRFNYENYPAGFIMGFEKVCIKVHSRSSYVSIFNNLKYLAGMLKNGINRNIYGENIITKDTQNSSVYQKYLATEKNVVDVLPLLKSLNIYPNNIMTYVKAMTHKSWTKEHNKTFDYERLEHVGDKAIGFFVSKILSEKYPDFTEGKMTKIASRVVSNQNLSLISNKLLLYKYCNIGNTMDRNNLPTKLQASLFESLIGAIQQDLRGYTNVIESIICEHLISDAIEKDLINKNSDYKSALQEICMKKKNNDLISYKTIKTEETTQGYIFTEALIINNKVIINMKGNKKRAIHQKMAKFYIENILNQKNV